MKEYILYGASPCIMERIVPKCIEKIEKDKDKILYYCDINSELWNDMIHSPEKIRENPNAIILILCSYVKEVVCNFKKMGIKNKILTYPALRFSYIDIEDNVENSILNYNWISENKDEILEFYNKWDKCTKDILKEIENQRKMRELEFLEVDRTIEFEYKEYFYDKNVAPKGNITLIDGGAFTGDTIEKIYDDYGENLKRIYAFEPNEINYKVMQKNLKKMKLDLITNCLQCGMYDKEDTLFFKASNDDVSVTSKIHDSGDIKIEVKRIDSIDLEVIGNLVIKMDIEGSELNALKGAKETIKKYTPYMAICIYHKMTDILDIPKYIKSINTNYNFYIRGGSHIECYAIPKNHKIG